MLLLVEFVRAAFLMSYLPAYGVTKLGFSVSMVGVAVTAHYAADTILKIASGYLLDRFSFRLILPAGLALGLLSLLSLQVFSSSWWLVVASTLYGVGLSPVWLVCVSYLQEDRRGTQMGAIYTAWMGGMGGGLFLTNFLLDRFAQQAFWLLLGLAGLSLVLSLILPKQERHQALSAPLREQLRDMGDRLKKIGPLLPGMILQTLAAGMLVPVLPSFVTKLMGLTYSQYSLLLLFGGVCAILGLIPMGRLSDHFGQKWFLVGGFAVFAVALSCLGGSRSLLAGCLWAVVLGLSYSAVLPAWNALLASQVSEQQLSVSWAVFSSVEGIGVMLGPILGGWIGDLLSARATLWMSAVVMGAIAIFYGVYPLQALLTRAKSVS
nr:MFS transporter [Tumebacillus amylolyticus]